MRPTVLLSLAAAALLAFTVAGTAASPRSGPGDRDAAHTVRAQAASLIMVDDPACHYCRLWHREVGGGYARTAEGRTAPLMRVGRNSRELSNFAPVVYTPTFILVRGGREVGRITGYPGRAYFWEELVALMSSAGLAAKG